MPQELTSEQRLTQIEQILKSAVKLSHSNTAKIDANTESIKANEKLITANAEAIKANEKLIKANAEAIAIQDQKIDRLTEQVGRAVELFHDSMRVMNKMQTNIETMQSEIKGLQIENRRMLDRFFGEDNSD